MNAGAFLLTVAGMSLALSGCGGGEATTTPAAPPPPTTTKDFQKVGTGACKAEDGGGEEYDCKEADAAGCKTACTDDGTCTAYETTTTVGADDECKGKGVVPDKKCKIHKKTTTKAQPVDHPDYECFRKVEIVDFNKGGACRTADDKEGEFTCEDLDAAGCKAKCLSEVTCTAWEMTESERSGDCEGKKCELHTTAITKTDRTDEHKTHHCFAVNPVTAEAEMFAV